MAISCKYEKGKKTDGKINHPGWPDDGEPCPSKNISWVKSYVFEEAAGNQILDEIKNHFLLIDIEYKEIIIKNVIISGIVLAVVVIIIL